MEINLRTEQKAVVESPLDKKIFLSGIAGAGKTTTGVERLRHLLESGVPAHSILVLLPHKRLALPYYEEIRNPNRAPGAEVTVATLGGLSRQIVSLFWPLITDKLSPTFPYRKPTFMTLEMVQYIMFKILDPEIERNDYFNSVSISRARLFSQIADNLNKSALVGFHHTQIAQRLKTALPDDPERIHIFEDAQASANLFRNYCVKYNLLDYSLQVTLFIEHLWRLASPRAFVTERYLHVIADNIEEDNPVTHRMLRDWLPTCKSALLIYDDEAGYRRFLGADAVSASTLREFCDESYDFGRSHVMSAPMLALHAELKEMMADESAGDLPQANKLARRAIGFTAASQSRFHTQMLDWLADSAASLVREKGVEQKEIVILAPLLHDSLRFSLVTRLESRGIAAYTLRPSRPLHSEPAVRALITVAKLAHPHWRLKPKHQIKKFDIVHMLIVTIGELDLTRASLIADVLFRQGELQPFDRVSNQEMRARITEVFGDRYDQLRSWIDAYKVAYQESPEPIDLFFRRLFGEALSQRGFAFHDDFDSVRIISNLIDSSASFRKSIERIETGVDLGNEYVRMVDDGILADQYEPRDWKQRPDAVLISPAYTFLLSNQPVDYQFWINIDSPAWSRRLYQPLTHPYVLSAQWNAGEVWTEIHERSASREVLTRVVTGLAKRCRKKIFVGFSRFDEQGAERQGELRTIFDFMLRGLSEESDSANSEEENG